MKSFEFVIVGSGLAGLSLALKASSLGRVAVISKAELMQANTWRAQGGLAAVISQTDSFKKHIQDTLEAGDGLCLKKRVEQIIENSTERVAELKDLGVQFDHQNGEYELGREGGHSQRRILHVDDQTGQALHSHFIRLAQENPNIQIFENLFAYELLGNSQACQGVKAFDNKQFYEFHTPFTALATGGSGKTFLYTSNWSGATGDGMIMAYKLGARLSNLEFTQFHPTCLFHPQARNFLISEALRGEGAKLLNEKNQAFMKNYHPMGDLAPRDKVARAIDTEMKASGSDCVWLDLSHLNRPQLKKRFPKIHQRCLALGIDFLKQAIPVVPAAHYMCGGIEVNESFQTSIPGLYAIGESCDAGLHGANRLASNSLLECLVSSHFAFLSLQQAQKNQVHFQKDFGLTLNPLPRATSESLRLHEAHRQITHMWEEVRHLMWHNMGLVRSQRLMLRAEKRLASLLQELQELKQITELTFNSHFFELENICSSASLMTKAALNRQESRGCHFDKNFPKKNRSIQKSVQQMSCEVEYLEI